MIKHENTVFLECCGRQILLVGTGHVLKRSVQLIQTMAKEFSPQALAVELDMARYIGLKKRSQSRPKNPTQLLLWLVQKKASEVTKTKPGADMLAAIRQAQKMRIPVYLIDQDIRITLSKLRRMRLIERLRMIKDVILSILTLKREEDITELLDAKTELIKGFKKEYPTLYRVFIKERDQYMARQIIGIQEQRTLVVVGAGHLPGLEKQLRRHQV